MPWKYMQYQNGQMRTTSDSGSSTLAELTDTNISSPSDNQFLTYNSSSSKWVNTTKSIPSNLNDLSDVNTSGVTNNKVLGYNSSSSKWVPMTIDPGGNVDDVKVNGTTVVDDNKIAQITSYKEVTRAEYDALPDTKLTDGVMYCISDGFSNPNGFPPLIYSTEEREVGVWVDGKPLYQKTWECTLPAISGSTTGEYVSLINLPDVSVKKVEAYESNGASLYPFTGYSGSKGTQLVNFRYLEGYIKLYDIGVPYSAGEIITVTVKYTKNSDIAGSGKWATDGGLAKHYSTQEQIIGTDEYGDTIYEKTLHPTISPGANTLQHGISNLKRVKKIFGSCKYNNLDEYLSLPYASNNSSYIIVLGNVTSTTYLIQCNSSGGFSSFQDTSVTIQYTKTTD